MRDPLTPDEAYLAPIRDQLIWEHTKYAPLVLPDVPVLWAAAFEALAISFPGRGCYTPSLHLRRLP